MLNRVFAKYKSLKLTMVACVITFASFSQQDPQYSQYMFNQLVINPAYTGSRDALSSVIDLRQQWLSMPGAPTTANISAHSPLKMESIGVGGHLVHDRIGPTASTSAYGDFAYRLKFANSSLSFGLSAGIVNLNFRTSEMKFKNQGEVFENQYPGAKTIFDAGVGLYYKTKRFYIGASATHITKPVVYNQNIVTTNNTTTKLYFSLKPHVFLTSGYAFSINDNCIINPSVLVKTIQSNNLKPSVDINCNVLLKNCIWLGASYKVKYGFSALAQYYINENFKIGYCYEFGLNRIGTNGGSTHEIMFGYDLKMYKNKTLSPRQLFL